MKLNRISFMSLQNRYHSSPLKRCFHYRSDSCIYCTESEKSIWPIRRKKFLFFNYLVFFSVSVRFWRHYKIWFIHHSAYWSSPPVVFFKCTSQYQKNHCGEVERVLTFFKGFFHFLSLFAIPNGKRALSSSMPLDCLPHHFACSLPLKGYVYTFMFCFTRPQGTCVFRISAKPTTLLLQKFLCLFPQSELERPILSPNDILPLFVIDFEQFGTRTRSI